MNIELLWFDGCPNHHAAGELLQGVLGELGVDEPIVRVDVPDLKVGERVKFPGSPTIRINGTDIDPEYEDTGDYTPRCRVYLTDEGFRGVPERSWIVDGVEAAA